jgi:hypothetical protein
MKPTHPACGSKLDPLWRITWSKKKKRSILKKIEWSFCRKCEIPVKVEIVVS